MISPETTAFCIQAMVMHTLRQDAKYMQAIKTAAGCEGPSRGAIDLLALEHVHRRPLGSSKWLRGKA